MYKLSHTGKFEKLIKAVSFRGTRRRIVHTPVFIALSSISHSSTLKCSISILIVIIFTVQLLSLFVK